VTFTSRGFLLLPSMQLPIVDFLRLRSQLPTIDVRSEGEYHEGHIAGAINIPMLTNQERREVGIAFKKLGQQTAIDTGFRLVGPRLSNIISDARRTGNELLVHCWRGGMRSANFCQFMSMAGIRTHQLQGGYKAYRTLAMDTFSRPLDLMVLGGFTGSGKSDILRQLKIKGEQILDLEHLAAHKGSVFGGLMMPVQPTTEQFQNELFERIIALDSTKRIWVEDESIGIGKIYLPEQFWLQMQKSPIVTIEVSKETRVKRLVDEYGKADATKFMEAMTKLTRKLGGQHFNAAKEKYERGDMAAAIDILLTYYDKAYFNGLARNNARLKQTYSWDGVNADHITGELIHT